MAYECRALNLSTISWQIFSKISLTTSLPEPQYQFDQHLNILLHICNQNQAHLVYYSLAPIRSQLPLIPTFN